MVKRVTWRSWAATAVIAAAWLVFGMFYSNAGGSFEEWVFKVGTLGGTFVPLILVGAYLASGNRGTANDVGAGMIRCALGIVIICAPLAYASWADGGAITPSVWGWIEVSGPAAVSLWLLQLALSISRTLRHGRGGNGGDKP
jgi:hypothetical protein